MFPYREDPLSAVKESIEFIKQLRSILAELDEPEIENILSRQNAVKSMRMLRKYFIK